MANNPLRRDPSRTTTLRRRFMAAMARRFAWLQRAITTAVVTQDVFGLTQHSLGLNVERGQFAFVTDDRKHALFMQWLQEQIDQGVLTTDGVTGDPWTAEYVGSAYKQAQARAYLEANRLSAVEDDGLFGATQRQFLLDSFAAAETVSKLRLIYTRSFDQLKGVTGDMAAQMSRVLADGLANGHHPTKIAKALRTTVEGMTRRRAMLIARTEIIHAHAEGQLDAFARLGLEEVGLAAEWATAGDPCPLCAANAGKVYSIAEAHGLIPLHPNCRCAWVPVILGRK